ncbi:hypothetical protein GY45DRAFT_1213382, partial [Cubamyces sp. BRFM 1775]
IRGGAPANKRGVGEVMDVTYLDLAIPPPVPLSIGQTVVASALVDHPQTPAAQPLTNKRFIAKPMDLEGTIEGVKSLERNVIELVVSNRSDTSTTLYAYLAMPLSLGTILDLGMWRNAAIWLARPFLLETREI